MSKRPVHYISPRNDLRGKFPLKRTVAAVLTALLGVPGQAAANNCTWNTTTGDWSNAGDWSCTPTSGQIPNGTSDSATIGVNGVVSVNVPTENTSPTVLTLNNAGQLNIDTFLLNLQGGGSTTNTGTINVGAGPIPNNAALQVGPGNNITNTGGIINVSADSVVNQFGSTITGGTINTTGTGALEVFSSNSNVLSGLTVNGQIDLATNANARERIANGLTLNGAINIANGGILGLDSSLTSGGSQTINGTGSINLNDAAAHLSIDGNGTTTLGSGITVQGQGNIGSAAFVGGSNTLINQGLISANVAAGTLNITPPGDSGSLVNTGTLQATGGGTLQLSTNTNNTGGQITAQNGSAVVQNGVNISGGNLSTSGTGKIQATSSSANVLDGVNFNGTLDLTTIANAREQIINGATINGAVNIANGGILGLNSADSTGNSQTIGGTAVINLNDAAARLSIDGSGSTTLGAGITVQGQGNIGQAAFVGGTNVLTSNGLISANVNGGTLSITAPGDSGSFINNGTLQAVGGGTLLLSTNITANAGSQIISGAGSAVIQNGISINGVFTSSGGGSFAATSSSSNVLNGVNFTGVLDLSSIANAREQIINGATINGAVNIANGGILGLNSAATTGGNQTLAGTVSINLNDPAARLSIDGSGSTTLGSGVTVHGQGNIGQAAFVGGTNTLTNNGLISADVNGGTLSITAPGDSGTFINNHTLQAVNGATLLLSTSIDNGTGQILAGAGSTIEQNGVTLNGVINTGSSGVLTAVSSSSNFLNGVNLTGTLDLSSIVNSREQIINGATINGSINIANGGILGLNSTDTTTPSAGNQTLAGTVSINLNDPAARLSIDGNGSTTLGSGVTVQGQGNIGQAAFVGGTNTLINNGLISANVAGGTLSITPPGDSGTVTNNNILEASNGGRLLLESGVTVTNGSAGQINALTGSVVEQSNAVIVGGTIGSSGTGVFMVDSASNFLNGVTVAGTVNMTTITNSREQIINGATINGSINIANGGILGLNSTDSAGNSQTIGGTGSINLNDPAAHLSIDGNGSTTLGAGLTVQGEGNIGQAIFVGGTNTLTNNGLISANVAGGTLSITPPADSGSLVNNGTLQAINGGVLSLSTAVANAGLISANGGNVNAVVGFTGTGTASTAGTGVLTVGASSSTGNLINNGTSANALSLGANSITVSGDYNNANFGTGNSFDRHANVSGSGQILAVAGTSQGVSGAEVTNGGTATPTLTLGNVRVGVATTETFAVDNTGTGATLRGAIQTTGGGAGIADTHLSVTPQNFGPVTPGTSSSPVTVTYETNTAGAISLSGSNKVGIVSNFDNVAGQLLNITTGTGAAAYNVAAGNVTPNPVNLGNTHVGEALSGALTVQNTAATGAFTEKLDASFGTATTGITTNGGAVNLLAAGGSNSSAMTVGVDTSTAGLKTGTVGVNFSTDGTGTSGLSAMSVGSQTVAVSGAVYNLASANTVTAVSFGNVHVGDAVSQAITIQNTAATGAFTEKLDASFGSATDSRITNNSGTISLLAAGATDSTSMVIGVNTSSAGTINGKQTVNFVSDGTGTSGLANTALPSQSVGVTASISGSVFNLASASPVTPNPVNFGNVRIGTTTDQALTIQNTAANNGFSEKLDASIGSATAGVTTNNGTISLLGPQATDSTSLHVGIDTTSAGAKSGTATIALDSNGLGTSGLGITNLASQTVNVSGAVYRLADPTLNTGAVTLAARVGDVSPTAALSITNTSPDIYTEGLKVSSNAAPTGFNASGAISNLGAGQTDAGSIHVGLNTSTAGTFTGNLTTNYTSTGAGTDGAADLSIGSKDTALTGKVYQTAVANVATTDVNFGIVHVGDVVGQALNVTNTAPVVGLNDTLKGNIGGATGPFTASGSFANLAAQTSDNTSLVVGLNTSTAGVFNNGSATVSLASHNADMADLALSSVGVTLEGTVNNYAKPDFSLVSGAGSLTGSGTVFNLNLGNLAANSGSINLLLSMLNDQTGPTDLIKGNYTTNGNNFFGLAGFNSFTGLGAGQGESGLQVAFNTDTLGTGLFNETVFMNVTDYNASGYTESYVVDLNLSGDIVNGITGNVPEPKSLLLMLIGFAGLLIPRRRVATLN